VDFSFERKKTQLLFTPYQFLERVLHERPPGFHASRPQALTYQTFIQNNVGSFHVDTHYT
jgi:hypothetical protein